MKTTTKLIKNKINNRTKEIRFLKSISRQKRASLSKVSDIQYSRSFWRVNRDLSQAREDARHFNIAWSMLKGKSYKQIEGSCRPNNKPYLNEINRMLKDILGYYGLYGYQAKYLNLIEEYEESPEYKHGCFYDLKFEQSEEEVREVIKKMHEIEE